MGSEMCIRDSLLGTVAVLLGTEAVLLGTEAVLLGTEAVLLGTEAVLLGIVAALLGSEIEAVLWTHHAFAATEPLEQWSHLDRQKKILQSHLRLPQQTSP